MILYCLEAEARACLNVYSNQLEIMNPQNLFEFQVPMYFQNFQVFPTIFNPSEPVDPACNFELLFGKQISQHKKQVATERQIKSFGFCDKNPQTLRIAVQHTSSSIYIFIFEYSRVSTSSSYFGRMTVSNEPVHILRQVGSYLHSENQTYRLFCKYCL